MDSIVQGVLTLISQHPKTVFWGIVAWWLISAATSAMPSPDDKSSMGYKFAYALLHSLCGSLGRVTEKFRIG